MITIYFGMWIYANRLKFTNLKINNSEVDVKIGDIFQEGGLKVIAFNEYFDTLVNEDVIASSTLNGKFIKQHIEDVDALDNAILESKHLLRRKLENDTNRTQGKTQKYRLGSIFVYDD